MPALDVTVIEHRRFPVHEATHKVGESTVEIAAHYLAHELGLREHLEQAQLPKFGLRLFFRGQRPAPDLAEYDELGASTPFPIPTYQLDRGRLENYLAASWRAMGGELLDGTTVQAVALAPGNHSVVLRDAGAGKQTSLHCRFLIDATGRRALLRRQCGLTRPTRHDHHAVWFRVAGKLDVDAWSASEAWHGRCPGGPRRLSTNHFMGPGYWLWLIPLASGVTSVGLVFDPKLVSFEQVRQPGDLVAWLAAEHPLVAERLAVCEVLDRHVVRNYAVGSREVFSDAGWMASGDAGAFSDPFYSPGGDFIALANGYIVDLIAAAAGPARTRDCQNQYLSFFVNTLALYRGQYAGFGNRDLMVAKTLWDYAYYWSVLAKLYFSGTFTDAAFMRANTGSLHRAAVLHVGLQRLFRDAARRGGVAGGEGRFFDQRIVPLFERLQRDLLLGEASADRLSANVDRLGAVGAGVRRLVLDSAAGRPLPPLDQVPEFE